MFVRTSCFWGTCPVLRSSCNTTKCMLVMSQLFCNSVSVEQTVVLNNTHIQPPFGGFTCSHYISGSKHTHTLKLACGNHLCLTGQFCCSHPPLNHKWLPWRCRPTKTTWTWTSFYLFSVFGVQSCMSVWISYSVFSVLVYIIFWWLFGCNMVLCMTMLISACSYVTDWQCCIPSAHPEVPPKCWIMHTVSICQKLEWCLSQV